MTEPDILTVRSAELMIFFGTKNYGQEKQSY